MSTAFARFCLIAVTPSIAVLPRSAASASAPDVPTAVPKPAVVTVPASGRAAIVIQFALAQVGKPYRWAAAGPGAYDCSGLVMAAYARAGIKLPHQSGQIAARGWRVPSGKWMPGDVIHKPGHVAIYLGGGKVVEAANPRVGVRVAPVRGGTAHRFL